MRKPTCLAYFLIVLLLGLVLSPILVFAQQDFNANYLISDEELQKIAIEKDDFHGEWNYKIKPRSLH